jgi:hypothetical protein
VLNSVEVTEREAGELIGINGVDEEYKILEMLVAVEESGIVVESDGSLVWEKDDSDRPPLVENVSIDELVGIENVLKLVVINGVDDEKEE